MDKDRGFLKKGGLCTEFSDKNKIYFEMVKATSPSKALIKSDSNRNLTQNLGLLSPTNTGGELKSRNILMKKKKDIKLSPSPHLDKAKEVIEQKHLYKIRTYLEKNGAMNK
jgi:hypothetical protein